MVTSHHSRIVVLGIATVLTVGLSAPIAVHAEEQIPALAPISGSSWDETSGYGVVESNRAMIGHPAASTTQVPQDVRWAPGRAISSGSFVSENRVTAARQALLSQDLGSMQEEALLAVVAGGLSWDATSGYGAVEASRAAASALLAPGAGPSWDETSGYGAVEASRATIGHPATSTTAEQIRVIAAQQALLSRNLGSLQEDALTAVVSASIVEGEARDDDALAVSRAELLAQFRTVELSLSRSLGMDQQLPSCAVER